MYFYNKILYSQIICHGADEIYQLSKDDFLCTRN